MADYPDRTDGATNDVIPVSITRSCANVRINPSDGSIALEDILVMPDLTTTVLKAISHSDTMPIDDVSYTADYGFCGDRSVILCF